MERVAYEIKSVGLYDLILQDVKRLLGKEEPRAEEILQVLHENPEILRDYKQTNVEYNLSNIHLKDIPVEEVSPQYREKARQINENLKTLREIEKYTLDFEQSSTLVLIFSVEFFVLFSVQYFIVLLNLKAYQWYIYGFFALSVIVAWWYAQRERKKFARENARFKELYDETQKLLEELEAKESVKKESLWILRSEEHV